jgi:hypothetical protein
MKNKKIITLIAVFIILGCISIFVIKNKVVELNYYANTLFETGKVYSEISGMLMAEDQKMLDDIKSKIKIIEDEIDELKTNSSTKEAEEAVDSLFLNAYEALELKEERLNSIDEYGNEGIFEKVTSVEEEFRALGKIIDKRKFRIW